MGFGDGRTGAQQDFTYTDPIEQYLNLNGSGSGTPHQQLPQAQTQHQLYNQSYQQQEMPSHYASTSTATPQVFPPTWGDQFLQDANNFEQQDIQQGLDMSGNVTGQNDIGGEQSFDASIAEL
jgi:hypothetical protein